MMTCLFRSNKDKHCISVIESKGIRQLIFGNTAIQSAINMNKPQELLIPYLHSLLQTQHFCSKAKKALLLGLGGGAMIHYLQHWYPKLHITAIESNRLIIQLAKAYFGIQPCRGKLVIKNNDAESFLKQCPERFDLIYVDLYSANIDSNGPFSHHFYHRCLSRLSNNGAIGFNLVCYDKTQTHRAVSQLRQLFKNQTLTMPVQGTFNLVVIGSKANDFQAIIERLVASNAIAIKHDTPTYGVIATGVVDHFNTV